MKKLLLLGALLCTACLAAQARNRYFTHLTLDDGISHNHIKAIVQDSYGFIWIGTKNGLNRYDGSSIRIFQCFDPATGTATRISRHSTKIRNAVFGAAPTGASTFTRP